MKNYFNERERNTHILAIGMEGVVKTMLKEFNALTEYEYEELEEALEHFKNFNDSIFERFGEVYKRKITNTMETKTVCIASKFTAKNDSSTYCDRDDIARCVGEIQTFNCCNCDRCDWQDCSVYKALFPV
ncbi:MAG: hypothetical protein J6A09_04280 [Alphaproteobacteria bacterium]|nr:hypothetical protein [Alphaproteobacteria bacterium]